MARNRLILATFLVLPFAYFSAGILHVGQHFAFLMFSLLIAAAAIKNGWLRAFYVYLFCWVVMTLLVTWFKPIPQATIKAALDTTVFFLAGAVLYSAVTHSTAKTETFYNAIRVSALLQSILCICQLWGADPFLWFLNFFVHAAGELPAGTMTGSLGNNNFVAAWLAVCLPFFFKGKWRWCLPILLALLLSSRTVAAVAAAFIGCGYLLWGWKGVVGAVAAGLAYLSWDHGIVYILTVPEPHGRIVLWREALGLIFYHPLTVILGSGPGAWWGHDFPMHNEFLQGWHQYGSIGLLIIAGYVVNIYRGNRVLFSAFLVMCVNMCGNYPLHLAPSAFLFILIAALIEREKAHEVQNTQYPDAAIR